MMTLLVQIIKQYALTYKNKLVGLFYTFFQKFVNKAKETQNFVTEDLEYVRVKESRWKTWFPFSFFYGNGRFQPLYYFVWLFAHIAATLLCLKAYGVWLKIKAGTFESDDINAGDIAAVLTFIGGIITIYTVNRNSQKNKKSASKDSGEA